MDNTYAETQAASKTKRDAASRAAYEAFMSRSETKLLVSMVPEAQPQELIGTLLKSAFDAGMLHGEGSIAGEMIGALLQGMEKDRKRGEF